jgi:hypothetical protein
VRSLRSLTALARRLGWSLDSGGTVTGLPYAEGVSLQAIVDDYTDVRVPPLARRYGANVASPPLAGDVSCVSITPQRRAVRVLYIGSSATTMTIGLDRNLLVRNFPGPVVTGSQLQVKREMGPLGSASGADAALQVFGVTGGLTQIGTFIVPGDVGVVPARTFLPLIVVPGESLVLGNTAVNLATTFTLAWDELDAADDLLTSQPAA